MKVNKTKILLIFSLIILAVIFSIVIIKILNKEDEIKTISNNEEQILNYDYNDEENDDDEILIIVDDETENEENITSEQNVTENDINKSSKEEEKKDRTKTKSTYFIRVNYQANTVTIYKKDDNEEYKPIKVMVCSTGTWTPKSGTYNISNRYVWRLLQGDVWGQYCTRITGSILFHSVPYTAKNKASLEYWEYDKLGSAASLGCIRLTVIDAKWIYDNIPKATQVEFYADSNPGPLGKPSARKISSEPEELRNWDPTDPDSNNPWKNWKEQDKVIEQDKTSENIENNDNKEIDIPKDTTTNGDKQDNPNTENKDKNEEIEKEEIDDNEIKNENDNKDNNTNNNENSDPDSDNNTNDEKDNEINDKENNTNSNEKPETEGTIITTQKEINENIS